MGSVTNHYFHVFDGIACSGTLTVVEFMLQEFLLNDRGAYIFFWLFWFRLALLLVVQQVHFMDSTMVWVSVSCTLCYLLLIWLS
jgi:hypothetical protein